MLKEKEKQKREEEEAKEQRKKEREEKRLQREEEKKQKVMERAQKSEERKKAEELERKRKERQEEQERKRRAKEEERELKRKGKENKKAKGAGNFTKTFMTRSKAKDGYSLQHCESSSNECTVCFGSYNDDLSSDGVPCRDWVQCTSMSCQKWMHEECIHKNSLDNLVCVCGNTFK